MPLRLDVKRKLTARSDRVKSVDLHATEPWMLASLYNGNVHVWNIESQQLVKSFEVCDLPVRASKFVARKNWVVTGSDDMQVRVFNYNTLERIHQFEAHSDYVRCIAVHPTQPFILTCSDDMTIKLWNWDKKWACQQVFEGHSHYVMQIVINPKDNNTFASASLDRTVKVWQLGSPQPNFTLEGHQRGVNCVDYYHGGDKPYLISGADDSLVKIWDYQNKTCVQTLEGHSQNVSSVSFHPELPIILTGSEDCTVRVWHVNTYRLENTLNYGLDRVWCISALKGSNNVCFGYDEGSVMIKLGREEPAMSMDVSGKIVWARHSEIQQANLKAMADTEIQDGERLPLAVKDLGACDIYPQTIAHNPNGRFVVVCGDGEYIIYTAMALRNKAFGPALDFVWALDSSEYAIRESNFNVKLFKNFKEKKSFKPEFGSEAIFGGYLLGCRSSATGLAFYDWETQELVRRIEIQPRQVFWSENGDYVCIATDENYFILKYSPDAVTNARDNKENVTEDGIEDAFDLVGERSNVQEIVKTGKWVGDCFIYTNSVNRLNYYVGGEIVTIAHLDRTLYLIGYIPKENRLYLGDKELNVVSYELLVSVLEYQTAVMRRDFDTADRVLPTIPSAHRTRVAHFLEKQGFKKQALAVSTDPEHRFDLALSLGELEVCHQLAIEAGSEHKWRLVADLAQQHGDLETAQTCLLRAHDYPGLLLQATSTGNARLIREVGTEAEGQGRNNVAFLSYFLTGNLKECLELLIKTNRVPEAAFFARTYLPSEMTRVVGLWKESAGEKIAQSLADPAQYDNLFPGFTEAVKTQKFLEKQAKPIPAASAASVPGNHERNPIDEMRAAETAGTFVYVPAEGEDSSPFVDAPSPTQALLQAQSLPEDEPLLSSTSVEPVASAPVATPLPAMSSEPLIPSSAIPPPSVSPVPDPMIGGTSLKEPDVEEENLIEALPPPGIGTKSLSKEMEFESALKIGAPTITVDQPVDDDWESDEKPFENIPPVKTVEDAEAVKDLDSDENLFDNVPSVKVVEEPEGKDWESDENLCENIPPAKVVEEPEGKDWESDENLFESDSLSKEEVEEAEVDDWESEENLFESDSPLDCAQEKDKKDDILKAPNAELREDILGLEDDAIPESGAAAAPSSSSSVGATRKFLDWDEEEAEDWGLEQKIAIDPQAQFTDCFEDVSLELRRERESPKFEVRHSPLVDLDEVKDLAAPSLIMGLPPFSASPPRGAAPFSASPPRGAAQFSASPPRGAALFSASPPRGAALFSASPPRRASIFSASPPRGANIFSASPPRGAAIFSASPRGAAPFSASPPRGAAIFSASPPRGGAALLEKAKPPRELGIMPMESDATPLRSNIAPLKFNAASMESEATILKPNMDLFGSEPTSLKFIAHPAKATAPPHDPPVSLGKAVEPPELPVNPKESTESLVDLAERPTELVGPLLEPATKHFTDSGKSLLDIDSSSSWHHFEQDSVDPVRDNRVEQRKPYVGSGRPIIDQAQLERELELDLENIRIDDNVDPSDVNLDEEDLLAD